MIKRMTTLIDAIGRAENQFLFAMDNFSLDTGKIFLRGDQCFVAELRCRHHTVFRKESRKLQEIRRPVEVDLRFFSDFVERQMQVPRHSAASGSPDFFRMLRRTASAVSQTSSAMPSRDASRPS